MTALPEKIKLDTSNPRIKIAFDIADRLKDQTLEMNNEIRGLLLGGSVSRGTDDEYSDVEILMFLTTIPTLEDRRNLISKLNFDRVESIDFDNNEDNLIINGIQVDLVYYTDDYDVQVITDVTEYCLPDYSVMGNIDTIRNGIILYGEDYLCELKAKCSEYKDELGENIVVDNLKHLHHGNMDVFLERDNPTEYYTNLVSLQKKIFNILSAVNKKYIGGYK
ncbi:MAG: nucleotidyltransferase domain-containing protein, partial [Clostridiaceae bacterium]